MKWNEIDKLLSHLAFFKKVCTQFLNFSLFIFSGISNFVFLFLVFCFQTAARCDTDSSYITFGSAIQGHVLHGPVFQTFAVSSEGRCRELCVESGRCVSYNYGSSNNQQLQTCEVLDRSYKNYTVRKKESFLFQAGKVRNNYLLLVISQDFPHLYFLSFCTFIR